MIKSIILASCMTIGLLTGCSSYKADIEQGNIVTQEELNQVKRGMSPTDVQMLLGTPLLKDDFNQNRWDYVFYLKQGNGTSKKQGVTVFFNNGVVSDLRLDQVGS
ncbi:MAG: outer membrane protein assembly factor BamE [Thiofilum sp.]|uniref:outer membrane protein assembly factor BamE n=1 Tax=Thiofilum sp. TaxID=2212733 RepID=UPI0025E42B5B|nr:outer membrane protein assembly factor BamE [Thiofilum sp.]MBK8451777.1 outer membrane protein assembly factor BamE [Thiofilum sp.]